MRLWRLNTQALFDHTTAHQMQEVATGIAHRGYFGHPAGFDLIASEMIRDDR